MKARNISKNIGKEVVIKVPLEEVTNCNGCALFKSECYLLEYPPLKIYEGRHGVYFNTLTGDVTIENSLGQAVRVHHNFIKLASEESK